ncbi:SET domain-containing protein 9-like isoform X1 [Mytilus edulis]|uniref:SET domain-containing protein 9-like isoform X1 n=1 Tax=Mytilus edulis TaxID=6550 RepID=UPI0039F0B731
MIFRYLKNKWKNYRYRFTPWIIMNLKERKVRDVQKGQNDKLISDEHVLKFFTNFLSKLENSPTEEETIYNKNLNKMRADLGFVTERKPSVLPNGGIGVFVTHGSVEPGTVVSMYPGLIYSPHEPKLFQSLLNPFIFRCIDGMLVDGNDKNLSKFMYRSCCQRDRIGPYLISDMSWLTPFPVNPLAVGQYVNNQSTEHQANVAYQEFDIPADFPFHLRKFIPNNFYSSSYENEEIRQTRVIVLVSLRNIKEGEELFSSYFTVVH